MRILKHTDKPHLKTLNPNPAPTNLKTALHCLDLEHRGPFFVKGTASPRWTKVCTLPAAFQNPISANKLALNCCNLMFSPVCQSPSGTTSLRTNTCHPITAAPLHMEISEAKQMDFQNFHTPKDHASFIKNKQLLSCFPFTWHMEFHPSARLITSTARRSLDRFFQSTQSPNTQINIGSFQSKVLCNIQKQPCGCLSFGWQAGVFG